MKTFRRILAGTALLYCTLGGTASAATADSSPLDPLSGVILRAIDGSTARLEPSEDGITRVLTAPNGSSTRVHFTFLSRVLGTVANADDPSQPTGVFRQTDSGLDAQFADGHSETLAATPDGGLVMELSGGTSPRSCMAWYPKGHVFSEAERRAAVAEYAHALGVNLPPAKDGARNAQACGTETAPHDTAKTAARDLPKSDKSEAAEKVAEAAKTILVKTSPVHLVDPPQAAAVVPAAAAEGDVALAESEGGPAASTCLGVDSDGHHWGFRNRCGYAVQFVYCTKAGNDPLTACSNGSVPGSVEAKGFAALTADKALSEVDIHHDFRWIACRGGAGEVMPMLDRTSPPSGRCIRAQAS